MSRRPWFARQRREAELDEEIRAHLAMARRDRVERGESPETAEAAARREFGNTTLVKRCGGDARRGLFGSLAAGTPRGLHRSHGSAAIRMKLPLRRRGGPLAPDPGSGPPPRSARVTH